jgi:hypothetical protein
MDVYIKPVIFYAVKRPDPAKVQAAYDAYLEKLKPVDRPGGDEQ